MEDFVGSVLDLVEAVQLALLVSFVWEQCNPIEHMVEVDRSCKVESHRDRAVDIDTAVLRMQSWTDVARTQD